MRYKVESEKKKKNVRIRHPLEFLREDEAIEWLEKQKMNATIKEMLKAMLRRH